MKKSIIRTALCFLYCVLSTDVGQADTKDSTPFEIDPSKIESVMDDRKHAIRDWILDLETTPMLANRLAVVVTGAYFTSGRMVGSDRVTGRQFTVGWATQNGTKNQRLILQDESLLDPVVNDAAGERYMQANASALDQLKLGDRFFEAIGRQIYPESSKSRLQPQFKQAGLFYPITAATSTATEWYRGTASNPTSARIEIERLTGSYQQGENTVAEFFYQSSDKAVLHRFVVFRDGAPLQVEDRMAINSEGRFRRIPLLNLDENDRKQLKNTRTDAVTVARTNTKWATIQGDLQLPIEIRTVTTKGPHAIEVNAKCIWLINEKVKASIFEPTAVGKSSPLQWLEVNSR